MWIIDVIQIVLVVLKIAGLINCSWWVVLSPIIVSFSIGICIGLVHRINKALDDFMREHDYRW